YLAEAIDEKVGEAITINEPTEYFTPMIYNMKANAMLRNEAQTADAEETMVDFKKIKLKYDVTVTFALK
ncbi:MAG TPA: hypothetical protein VHK91_07875, partial [Flavisolibacter sp.]|nr:hypothetical protein [Flavisolibacter sp.]